MGRLRRKRMHKNIKDQKKKYRTKRRTKDIDEIHRDLEPENSAKLLSRFDPELPGSGQHYCLQCARTFVNNDSLSKHMKSKNHKKRLKELMEKPYDHEEAEAAGGKGSYVITSTRPLLPDTNMDTFND
ncbi:zinc finger protein 593-like [Xenia sp. Carnegie-2017]|uniref:zinc finger protein 593-like n=1 Tax=Xenia sp. Carnegie-2017 TaxID=2897299 RepID=UPI001F03E2A8|nr:zinc finger protein 593-like [Xenia sp. Carnegie-2017]XP_046845848.1 zinc finger protein 593-like [Xenia sp. Carnegie-2017]XP_046845849.1 zinc finger protein 593-like [Xenia sp. Carnegie-2017]